MSDLSFEKLFELREKSASLRNALKNVAQFEISILCKNHAVGSDYQPAAALLGVPDHVLIQDVRARAIAFKEAELKQVEAEIKSLVASLHGDLNAPHAVPRAWPENLMVNTSFAESQTAESQTQ